MPNKLYTLGYTGLKPERLKAIAEQLDAVVADIRYSPRSRVPYWNAGPLARLLGDRYQNVKALGNVNYAGGGPIKLSNPEAGAKAIKHLIKHHAVILLCACKEVAHCHRKQAAEFVGAKLRIEIEHLNPATMGKPSQPALLEEAET